MSIDLETMRVILKEKNIEVVINKKDFNKDRYEEIKTTLTQPKKVVTQTKVVTPIDEFNKILGQ